MDSRAKRRLALVIAATVAFAAFIVRPVYACDSTAGCLNGVAANALPTYPEPTAEAASEPVKLKKFTKPQARAARKVHSRKATLAQRAQGSKLAKAKEAEQAAEESRAKTTKKVVFANANAEFVNAEAARTSSSEKTSSPDKATSSDKAATPDQATAGEQARPPTTEAQTAAAQPPTVELAAAEEYNDLDRAAWESNQMPRLMQLTDSNSRAELRDDDSRWAQTSMIGKLFVAFGALLTIGSAIRMFMA
jgi:hypothetical protein